MSEVETNPVEDLVQAATSSDYNTASEIFNDLIGQKMQDALEQEKIAVANQIYNGVDPVDYESDEDDIEITDDDLNLDDEDTDFDDEVED